MKQINNGGSLFQFFLNSGERLIPMCLLLCLIGASSVYYLFNEIDAGFYFCFSIWIVALVAMFLEGFISWKRTNK